MDKRKIVERAREGVGGVLNIFVHDNQMSSDSSPHKCVMGSVCIDSVQSAELFF